MKLRPPSIDQGVQAFLWAFGLGVFLYFGMLAVGVSKANAFIFAALAACLIFLFVRLFGEAQPRRPRRNRGTR